MAWLEGSDEKAILHLWVQPRAAKASIVGVHGDALKIKLTSPPVDGKANDQLLGLLSKRLDIPASQIIVRAGHTGRRKTLEIKGLNLDEIRQKLAV